MLCTYYSLLSSSSTSLTPDYYINTRCITKWADDPFPLVGPPQPCMMAAAATIIPPPSSRDLLRDPEPSGHSSTERGRIPAEALRGRLWGVPFARITIQW